MNRLHLRIFDPSPEQPTDDTSAPSAEPDSVDKPRDILPFLPQRTTIISGRMTAPVDRARILRDNASCPDCEKSDVEPIELQDGIISPKSRLPIPGTATIVGFHCNSCGIEWPVYELTTRRNG